VTQYNHEIVDDGLFVEYINTLLKLKAEASGYPSWVRTTADEDRYIESFWQSEGVRLDTHNVRNNAGKQGWAKLCLNSMWGRLGERALRSQRTLRFDPQELYRFLATPGVEVSSLLFVKDQAAWISWLHSDERHAPSLKHANDVIASYVTAGARMHLYKYLDRLQDKALYCDTDSVIYIQPRDEQGLIETGDCLGDMTSELKPGHHICEFVCAGPKNYAYKTVDPVTGGQTTVYKVRGITLNYSGSQLVNFETIKKMILNRGDEETVKVGTEKQIKRKRDKEGVHVITEPEEKIYRVSFLKRRRLFNNSSVSFGYVK
jgi:hypothetical protein